MLYNHSELSCECQLWYAGFRMLTERELYSADNCSLGRALELVGERWTMLVMREAFLGARRFDDFQRLTGCARNVLAARLAKLVDSGIFERVPYREPNQRARHEYLLTEKGRDLATAVVALVQWGDRWEADAAGPPVVVGHRRCGSETRAAVVCRKHGTLNVRDITASIGPGAKRIA